MKRKITIEIISALFILLFLYTAINKTFNIQSTIDALAKTPILGRFASLIAWAVVVSEYVISFALFVPKFRKIGMQLSAIILTLFTAYISLMKMFIPDLPCTCGGIISSLDWTQHLILNIFLMALSCVGLICIRITERKRIDKINEEIVIA